MSDTLPSNVDTARTTLADAPTDDVSIDYDSGTGEVVFDVLTQDVDELREYLDDTNLEITHDRWVAFGVQASVRVGDQ